MTVVKFRVVIRRDKLSKSTNEAPVCLRITKDRKVTYKTLLHLDPKYWNEKEQCVKKQHPNAEGLNADIVQKDVYEVIVGDIEIEKKVSTETRKIKYYE